MKISVLASGSKGNCTYFETGNLKFLVDLGPSAAYVVSALKDIGVDPNEIDMIFLTHTHSDHIGGLKVFLKKYHTFVYLTEKMQSEIDFTIDNYEYIDDELNIADLNVQIVKTSHDVADSNGYVFTSNGRSVVLITDTGYIHVKNFPKLKDHNLYIFESNHDIKMLREGKYPYYLQQRILSDKGHLSNKDSSYYLSEFVTDNTNRIILIHLSEENNDPEIALETLIETFNKKDKKVPEVLIARQKERTELLEV